MEKSTPVIERLKAGEVPKCTGLRQTVPNTDDPLCKKNFGLPIAKSD